MGVRPREQQTRTRGNTVQTHSSAWARLVASIGMITSVLTAACNSEAEFAGQALDKVDPKVVLDQEFAAGEIADANVRYQPLYGRVEEGVTMALKPPVTTILNQIQRTAKADDFTQGHDGTSMSEQFQLSSAGKLDLLVVVDNSISMLSEQTNLAGKLGKLTSRLQTVDWQIAVITTDTTIPNGLRNGGKPIKKGDPKAAADFAAAVSVGNAGDGDEQGLAEAYDALKDCDKEDHPWLRSDASLAVFFVSDEEDHSTGGVFGGGRVDPSDLVARMKSCRPVDKIKGYSLTWRAGCPFDPQSGETDGLRYREFAGLLGGVDGSICVADYSATLGEISADVSKSVKRELDLKFEPTAGSLDIKIDGKPYTDYELIGKKIVLKNVTGDVVQLKASYSHNPVARFDRVTLSATPAADTVEVFQNGKVVDPSKYSYDPGANEVVFVDMPSDKAKVKVKYRMDEALAKDFDFAKTSPEGEVLGVTVDGAPATDYTIDEVTRVVTFVDPPKDGAEIGLEVRAADSEITRYAVGVTQDSAKVLGVAARDATTSDEVPVSLDAGELVFDVGDVAEGRQVIVTYDYGDAGTVLSHELANLPIEGTLTVKGVGTDDCVAGITVKDRVVSFTCDADELEEVEIAYKYEAQRFSTFELGDDLPADAALQVFVDGGAIGGWRLDGRTLVVPEDKLKVDSIVRVIATVYGTRK